MSEVRVHREKLSACRFIPDRECPLHSATLKQRQQSTRSIDSARIGVSRPEWFRSVLICRALYSSFSSSLGIGFAQVELTPMGEVYSVMSRLAAGASAFFHDRSIPMERIVVGNQDRSFAFSFGTTYLTLTNHLS